MTEFVIHGIHGSPFVRAVQLVLEEKGAPWRLQPMALGERETRLKLHAFGRMPVVDHGDFRLYETQAILRYVDAVIPEPALQPKDARAAARMDQIIGVNDWYLFPQVTAVIGFHRIVGPKLMGLTPDEAKIAEALPNAHACVRELERLLHGQPFLAGDSLSLADLMVAPQLTFLAMTPEGEAVLEGSPLKAWLARMDSRPSMAATRWELLDQAA